MSERTLFYETEARRTEPYYRSQVYFLEWKTTYTTLTIGNSMSISANREASHNADCRNDPETRVEICAWDARSTACVQHNDQGIPDLAATWIKSVRSEKHETVTTSDKWDCLELF
jgi:hypothetical protein